MPISATTNGAASTPSCFPSFPSFQYSRRPRPRLPRNNSQHFVTSFSRLLATKQPTSWNRNSVIATIVATNYLLRCLSLVQPSIIHSPRSLSYPSISIRSLSSLSLSVFTRLCGGGGITVRSNCCNSHFLPSLCLFFSTHLFVTIHKILLLPRSDIPNIFSLRLLLILFTLIFCTIHSVPTNILNQSISVLIFHFVAY